VGAERGGQVPPPLAPTSPKRKGQPVTQRALLAAAPLSARLPEKSISSIIFCQGTAQRSIV
jgi:hypothetical protein